MKITIKYDSCWRNSFLDGDNNNPIPKEGRKYIASLKALGEKRDAQTKISKNFLNRKITKDTVMGVLNRLIGDQRKLYQSRQHADYYFTDIEDKIGFDDKPVLTQEMTYLRNISGNTDQNSFTGAIRANDANFTSDYSNEFWGILTLDFEALCQFIANDTKINSSEEFHPLKVVDFFQNLKLKPATNEGLVSKAVSILWEYFKEEINYFNTEKEIVPLHLYCSALYLQLNRLSKKYDMSSARTPLGGIKGISKRLFTKKDFMEKYVSGGKKIIFGNPYIHKYYVKNEVETINLMTKASGKLDITLDITKDEAQKVRILIRNAGVSSFYLGKKGLAYVEDISIQEEKK